MSAFSLAGLGPVRAAPAAAVPISVQRTAHTVRAATPQVVLTCDLDTGLWQARWPRGPRSPGLGGADAAVTLTDGTKLAATACPTHLCAASDVIQFRDALGRGTQFIIHHQSPGRPELRQSFRIYPGRSYFFVRLEVRAAQPLATRDISPLVVDAAKNGGTGLGLGDGGRPRTLFVPYDNDNFVRYNSDYADKSFEVTAVYDNASRHGFVIGSVTHDLWKTGITLAPSLATGLIGLRVFGGVTGPYTHDTQPHGAVTGRQVASPLVLVGYFPDWREGMEIYGRVNARLEPPLVWKDTVPTGWNSWAADMTTVSDADFRAASDFLHDTLRLKDPATWSGAYVNFDSFWDNLSEPQRIDAAKQAHAQGQRAGIYWTPFVYWGKDLSQTVDGTDGRYTYQDIVLKDADGKLLPALDGGLPLDPTHPGTLARIDWQCRRFAAWGFEFVKLDFLTHGALEGAHFDPKVTTGTAAYRVGMARMAADLSPARIGRPFFISLSIAPLFPAGSGHSRRISCDTFGSIANTEYMLNSLTYGWWEGGTVYAFNDGDHAVLYQARGQAVTTPAEGRSRLDAAVATGGLILDSDNLVDPKAQERVASLLGNPEVLALARAGRPFRPVEGDTGSRAAAVFVRSGAKPGECYVAVFNYSASAPVTRRIELSRLGLSPSAWYRANDLWTKQDILVSGTLSVALEPGASTLLHLTRQ